MHYTYIGSTSLVVSGYTREELLQMTLYDSIGEEELERFNKIIAHNIE
jgi:hypothetical protein